MEINNPKISFEYTNSFGDKVTMNTSLENDTIFVLAQAFKSFLYQAGFSTENIRELFADGLDIPDKYYENYF